MQAAPLGAQVGGPPSPDSGAVRRERHGRSGTGSRIGTRGRRRRGRADWQGYLYIIPAVAVFALFVLVPLGQTVDLSFYSWDGLTPEKWVGLGNFRQMVHDPLVRSGYLHSAVLVVFYCVFPILIALLLSALLSRHPVRGMGVFRTVLFLPQVISTVVVGIVWRFIYAPDGPLNAALRLVGLGRLARPWLADFTFSLPAIGAVGTWVLTGFCLVLFLTGIQQIPTELYDAARVDGAGAVREFFAVTLPGLRNVTVIAVSLTLIAALRTFDLIYVTTRGGPGTSSIVPGILVYQDAFDSGQNGYAAAIATTLMLIVFAVTFTVLRFSDRETT